MRQNSLPLTILLVLAIQPYCFCQQTTAPDTTDRMAKLDSLPKLVNWNAAAIKRQPVYKLLALPVVMIAYGAVTLKSEGLQDWNEEIKDEVYAENPHKQVHIDNYLQWAPAVAVYGLNMVGIKGAHNFRDRTVIYGLSTLIMSSTVFGMKTLSGELRPDASNRYSFPSGHTATAFAAAEFMRKEYKDVSPWYGIAGYAMAATTGYLRMYNNKHWLSDVVAGAGIGILSTDLAYRLYPAMKRMLFKKEKESATAVMPFYQDGAIGLGLVHHF